MIADLTWPWLINSKCSVNVRIAHDIYSQVIICPSTYTTVGGGQLSFSLWVVFDVEVSTYIATLYCGTY